MYYCGTSERRRGLDEQTFLRFYLAIVSWRRCLVGVNKRWRQKEPWNTRILTRFSPGRDERIYTRLTSARLSITRAGRDRTADAKLTLKAQLALYVWVSVRALWTGYRHTGVLEVLGPIDQFMFSLLRHQISLRTSWMRRVKCAGMLNCALLHSCHSVRSL